MIKFSHLINIAMELWRLRYLNRLNFFEDKFPLSMLFLLRSLRNSSGILLGSRACLDRLVARFLRWYKVGFDNCSLWFSINFTMEDSLNVDSFDKSLLFWISFTMEGSLLRWLKTVSSTFQDVDFDVSLLPLVITWCYNHGIKKLPNHRWTCWYHFCDTIGYHSNTMTR